MTSLTRRRFLTGASGVAAAGALTSCAPNRSTGALATPDGSRAATFPFYGRHQAGVATTPTPAGMAAGLDVRVETRDELNDLLITMSDAIEHVMSARPYERRAGGFPPRDTGLLGPNPGPTDTSIVVGFGHSLFDDRFGLADRLPVELTPMPKFANDYLVRPERSHGDISLVINAAHSEAVTHAFRQILRVTRGRIYPKWMQTGFQHLEPAREPGEAPGRNLMGFKDGTVNPPVDDDAQMDETVWIAPDDDQPDWFEGGTYQALRVIRMQLEFWDRTRLNEQEEIFHRHRDSGAPLGATEETDTPEFNGDLTSHIARANPRNGTTPKFQLLRRGYNYANGIDSNDQLDQGLLFISYQRSFATGFTGVQRRLDGEALEEYIRPVGGGFFAVPPAPDRGEHLGSRLLA